MGVEFVGVDDSSLQFATTEAACAYLGCTPQDLAAAVLSRSEVCLSLTCFLCIFFLLLFFHFPLYILSRMPVLFLVVITVC